MSSRQDNHQFLQANNLKEAGERMTQFTEFVKCQNPAFNGDLAQLSPEELSTVAEDLKNSFMMSFVTTKVRNSVLQMISDRG